jgi:hypothetical protein
MGNLARDAARRFCGFGTLTMRPITVPVAKPAAPCWRTAVYRDCSDLSGRVLWKSWRHSNANRSWSAAFPRPRKGGAPSQAVRSRVGSVIGRQASIQLSIRLGLIGSDSSNKLPVASCSGSGPRVIEGAAAGSFSSFSCLVLAITGLCRLVESLV